MRAYEFIPESTSPSVTVRLAKELLIAMGFAPTGRRRGSHDVWKDETGQLFTLPLNKKELEYGVTKNLLRLIKQRESAASSANFDIREAAAVNAN